MFKLSQRSISNLEGVHPDLVKVVHRAIEITEVDFIVTEGLRSEARQRNLYKQGKSKTLNSRHLTGHAIDVAAISEENEVTWKKGYYYKISKAMKKAAEENNIDLEWGGDWKSFYDGVHFQLSWASYPIAKEPPKLSWWQKLLSFFKRRK